MRRDFLIFVLSVCAIVAGGCACGRRERDIIFQESTINALMAGVYDGEITCGELRRRGDIGLGTFEALDGEMVAIEGIIYQVTADGTVRVARDDVRVPFAEVTYFTPDITTVTGAPMDLSHLPQYLDSLIPSTNIFYAVRIDGTFSRVRTRSVPRQAKPYPPLDEAVKDQREFEYGTIEGTLVGFRYPVYARGINIPGYHFHLISSDRKAGGHLLDCRIEKGKVAVDCTSRLFLSLPREVDFYGADLSRDRSERGGGAER